MHVAQQLPERHVVFEIKNVAKRVRLRRVVVEHQQHAGERQHDEEIERDAAHAPRKRITHGVAIDLRRMQVKKDVGKNRERTVTRIGTIVRDAEDRFPKLRLLRIFIILRLVDRASLERTRALFNALDETLLVAFFARRQLFCFFWVLVHLRKSTAYTVMKAPGSSKWLFSPFGHSKRVAVLTTI